MATKQLPKKTTKTPAKKTAAEKKPQEAKKKEKYHNGLGRRKRAIAQVRIFESAAKVAADNFTVNGRPLARYFSTAEMQDIVNAPLISLSLKDNLRLEVKVKGGGVHGQAEAVRLGVSRALLKLDESHRKTLRDSGYLTRDARKVERKKAGLKKARRAPQWKKR